MYALQTHLSNWIAVTQKQSVHLVYFTLVVVIKYCLKRTYFRLINLKRKQALLESNLSAIRLMTMIIKQRDKHITLF